MNPNTVLSMVGIAATVVLSALAIYLAFRYSRQVGIAYLEDTCLSLIDDITQGISDLEIRFRNSPVSENIVLLKGHIINTGKRDISPAMVEKRLRLVLPEGFKWIDCQIIDRAKNLKIQVANLTTESIEFDFSLFKTQEYFKFDALATVPSDDEATAKARTKPPNSKLREVLEFDYRITDTHDIQKLQRSDLQRGILLPPRMEDPLSDRLLSRAFRLYSWFVSSFWMALFLIVAGVGFYFLFTYLEPKRIAYEISGPDNQTIVTHTGVKDGQIELYNQEGFKKAMSPKEFDELQKTTVVRSPGLQQAIIASLTYIGLGALLFLIWIIRFVRTRKYRQILRLAKS